MRTSTTVFLFAFAGSACATSESIEPGAIRGTGMFLDSGDFDTGAGIGGDPGAGGSSAGGFTAAGGFVANGGTPAAGGSPPPPGGSPSMGGASSTGGAPPMGGSSNGGAQPQGGSAGSCQATEKVCGGICVRPAPSNGCGTTGCTACATPAPTNGIQSCNNGQCDFNCLSGFTKSGNTCTGPTGGGGGGGGGGTCNAASCPACALNAKPCCGTVTKACSCELLGVCL